MRTDSDVRYWHLADIGPGDPHLRDICAARVNMCGLGSKTDNLSGNGCP